MQHLDDVRPLQEFIEGRKIKPGGEGIDDAFEICLARRRHLDQAELGIIGLVAQEFGVQRQIGRARKLAQKGRQRLVGFDNPHQAVIADSAPRVSKNRNIGQEKCSPSA